ncbi:MAG: ATP-binding cassette domain-containing protein [Candidatus Marinimicrobia bacterium]|nr:ATP-binding cassette domain-containing protein [Candidatus Neomarinimicrobiota bacterium]
MKSNLFQIPNLTRYFDGKPVLNIQNLNLPRGEVICIVGESGCGKTTLLELLGLMTHPLKNDPQFDSNIILLNTAGKKFDYRKDLWYSDEKSAEVRRQYFSFLFQQANLLPDLNVQENVMLPSIIKSPLETLENIKEVDRLFNEVQIAHRKDFATDQLSIGQKQRTAFARSVFRHHSVLFADEPTGNLDPFNSRTVFELIRQHVNENPENSAIIVTHNIESALEFSDRMAALSRNGFCDSARVFYKKEEYWYCEKDNQQYAESEARVAIESLIQDQIDKSEKYNHQISETKAVANFEKFYGQKAKNEFSLIQRSKGDKRKINLSALLIMLILTAGFLAIGFANGSLKDLARKMSDPFVNWLDVELTDKYRYQPDEVINKLQGSGNFQKYSISQISRFSQFSVLIYDQKINGSRFLKGRTISLNDEILTKLTGEKFLVRGTGFKSEKDLGLVVTESFFEKYHYDKDALFVRLLYSAEGHEDKIIPIPIKGVVKELPGDNEFLSTDYFKYELYHSRNFPQPFNPNRTDQLLIFAPVDEEDSFILLDSLEAFLSHQIEGMFFSDPQLYNEAYLSGHILAISFEQKISLHRIDSLFKSITNEEKFRNYSLTQFYRTNFDNRSQAAIIHDNLSVNLNDLGNVLELKDYFLSEFNISLDIARVELLNNFFKVKKITIALSWTIIFFTIFSINIFVFFYLYINLYKQRIHLGSLKAFGLTSGRLRRFYVRKMMVFLIRITGLSLGASILLGYAGFVKFLWQLFTGVKPESLYFDLIDFQNLMDVKNLSLPVFLLLLMVGTYFSLKIAGDRILSYSPGDLVKDRIK